MKYFIVYSLAAIILWPAAAFAAPCTNPSGDAGDQVYNTTYNVMQYCNGSHWVAMGSVMEQGDNLGNRTSDGILNMSGFRIENLGMPTADMDAVTKQYVDDAVSEGGVPSCSAGAVLLSTSSGWQCSEECTYGPIGSVCVSDDAIYIGIYEGKRIYVASADEGGMMFWDPAMDTCQNKSPKGMWHMPARGGLALLWDNGNRKNPPGQINLSGIGIHASDRYWSATASSSGVSIQQFSSGAKSYLYEGNNSRVRCVRY